MRTWVIGAILLVGACDRGTDVVSNEDARDDCESICKHADSCVEEETDIEGCTQDCVANISGWMRADASETIAECESHLSCDEEDEVECTERVKPLAIHRTWSGKCVMNLAICDGVDEASCAIDGEDGEDSLTRLIAEPIMKKLVKCLDQPDCDSRLECTNTILENIGMAL